MPFRSRQFAIAAIVSAAASVSLGEKIVVQGGGAVAPAEMKDLQSVYVRDSGVASEKIALAERMERLKEWDKSANIYQEIIEKYADRVIPTRSDETGQVSQYTSVALVVQERLAKWPDEGLAVYRARYEDAARDALERAQIDRSALQRVFSQYFATDSGKTAGLRLVAIGLERGEFASAAWVGRRMLAHHPSLLVERPKVLFQTAIAEHLAGNNVGAQQRLDELKQKFANAAGALRGQDVVLATALEKELASQQSLVRTFRSDSWPVPFGSLDASAVPEQVSFGGARMFSTEIPKASARRTPGVMRDFENQRGEMRKIGGQTGIMPAVDNGEMFFQDNSRIFAINLASGLPLTGWLQTYPGEKKGAFSLSTDATTTPPGKTLGVCVTDKSVVAILGQNDVYSQQFGGGGGPQTAQLVCLDRNNGKRIWSQVMQKIKLPDDQGNLRESQFYGMPLVVEDSVYVLARASRGGQFEECHVVSLKLSDGSFQWASYVASTASGGGFDFDMEMSSGSSSAMLSYSDGRLYALTNLGAVACLDSSDGKTIWLNIYPRKSGPGGPGRARIRPFIGSPNSTSKPFAQNPPMIADGRLFVAPSDSQFILAYDAASGEEIRRLPRTLERGKYEPVDMLLGIVGEQMVLGNRSTVFVIPWEKYDTAKTLVANGGKYKKFRSDGEGQNEEEAIRGRPFVSAKSIFVPTSGNLYRVGLDQFFKTESVYPQQGTWDEAEEAAGNVLATPDHLIIAAPNRVTVYADLNVATRKLDELIERDPTVTEPYLRYAELLLAGGRATDAIDWLDKAIDRMGGRSALVKGAYRERLFEIAAGFGSKFQRTDGASPEVVRQLFDRAKLAADTPQQQVRYRMAHAAFMRKNGDVAPEITLYQEILAQPEWRNVSVAGRSGASTASVEAEAAITELVTKNPTLYAAYEADAKSRLDALTADANSKPAAYIAIAEEFPVSNSTVPALQSAAGLYEAAGDPRQANQTLRRLLKRAKSNSLKVTTLEALARNYTAIPNQLDLAIVRLEQAAKIEADRKLSKPIKLDKETVDGKSLADAVQLLKVNRTYNISSALPTLKLPSGAVSPDTAPFRPAESLDGVSAVIRQQAGMSRNDRVVVLKNDQTVIQLEAGTVRPLHSPTRVEDAPIGCAYSGDSLILITGNTVSAIHASGGKQLWRAELSALPGAELAASDTQKTPGGEDAEIRDVQGNVENMRIRRVVGGAAIRIVNGVAVRNAGGAGAEVDTGPERVVFYRVLSDRVVVGTSNGRVVSYDINKGTMDWQVRPSEMGLRHFQAVDDFVVVSSTDQFNQSDVFILDAITGQISNRMTFDPNQGKQLMNLALSRDGVLVSMLMNEISARDLYDTAPTMWRKPAGNRNNGEMPFMMSGNTDQLVITDGRVLATATSNDRQVAVRAYDLRTGDPVKSNDPKANRKLDAVYPSGAPVSPNGEMPNLSIRSVGPVFYIVSPKTLAAYHLDKPWQWNVGPKADIGAAREFFVAQDYCILLSQSAAVANANAPKIPAMQLSILSRSSLDSGAESGLLEYRPTIREPAQIVAGQWQIADGAFYYVSGDQKLKMLKANTPK